MGDIPGDYDQLLDEAEFQIDQDAKIEGEEVVYSSRSIDYRKSSTEYNGKIKKGGKCVKVIPRPQNGIPVGLSGETIAFSCEDEPTEYVYHRTRTHRGVWGLLRDKVVCILTVSWYGNR